jgi:hypothetical protein
MFAITNNLAKLQDNYEIIVKIGKDNGFMIDFSLENNLFFILLNEFLNNNKWKSKKNEYSLYYDKNLILNIFLDGSSFVYTENNIVDYDKIDNLKFKYDLFLKMYNINNLKNDDFPNKKNYDYIVNIKKYVFSNEKNINVHFIQKYDDKMKKITYEIEIHLLKDFIESELINVIHFLKEKIK